MDRKWWNKPTCKPVWIWGDTLLPGQSIKQILFAAFHRLHFIHSSGTRGFTIMEEKVDGAWRKKSMMNYTSKKVKVDRKQSPPTFNQELLKIYQLQQKKESGWGNGQITCWSRIGNKHTNAWISLMTQTQIMMITTLQAISHLSLLHQWCTITLAIPIPM